MDVLLSLDPGPRDILYRIRRSSEKRSRVLYVTVTDLAVIPEEKSTHGPSVIAELSKLTEWSDSWTTLHVFKECGKIRCEMDTFCPHRLPTENVRDFYPTYDILDLKTINVLNHRVSEVTLNGRACVLKIARFAHEMPSLIREVEAYYHLAESSLAPKLIGYAYEETPDRIIGLLIEHVDGRTAESSDLESCQKSLQQLHRFLIHGDLCRYNIIITPNGPKFIDFESSILCETTGWTKSLMDAESSGLSDRLADKSGSGRPWDVLGRSEICT